MHNKQKALDVIEFIQMLKHTGDFYGQPFNLLDWEHQIIWDVYGTMNDKGYRQYQYAYLEIPKKNGKTELTAGLALYHLFCDGPSGQIYCCAAEKEQAALVYRAAKQMIEQEPAFEDSVKIVDSKKEIHNKLTNTFLKVLSAEAYSKHGLNPTVVIFDELHAQPNRELWDVMTFGAGAARKQPLWWVITTAGDDPDRHSVGWEQHEYARRLIDGEIVDPTWYAKIYCAKEDEDIFDEAVWHKANPSLGHAIDIDTVRKEAIGARNSESKEKLFRWLRLNQWVALKVTGWLPLTLWDQTTGSWNISELTGKRCHIGIDLSNNNDITAACLLFPPQEELEGWRAIFEAWIPEENMKERVRKDKVPYDTWVQQKYMHATPGNVIDPDYIISRLINMSKQYEVIEIDMDPWRHDKVSPELMDAGLEVITIKQNIAHMSPAMKEIELLLKSGQLTHDRNPVARWCWGNVVIYTDGNENIKPMKNKSRERIDLTVALINAMARAMLMEEGCVYDTRPKGEKVLCF